MNWPKDGEIRQTTASKETAKNLEVANAKIKELEDKIRDLKFQVRHGLMKNIIIEKHLETIPSLKDDIREKDDENKMLSKDVEKNFALLLAARTEIREYKEKLREGNQTITTDIDIQDKLFISQCEVYTLKSLMAGKDMLVLQKSQALALAKETIDSLQKRPEIGYQVQKIQQILMNLSNVSDKVNETKLLNGTGVCNNKRSSDSKLSSSKSTPRDYNKEINVPPYSMENGHDNNNKHSKSNNSFKRVTSRSKTSIGLRGKESVSQNGSSSGNMKRQDYSDTVTDSSSQELVDAALKMSQECRMEISEMSAIEKDDLLSKVINVGARVSISLPQILPKYGRKKRKPITYNGIVKFKGIMEKKCFDIQKYVGVKLDLPIGDSDGMYKGKRYMFTPPKHGKFFKMKDVTAMLNIQTGYYEPMMRMMVSHLGSEYRISSTTHTDVDTLMSTHL